jgi:hypothetical protein
MENVVVFWNVALRIGIFLICNLFNYGVNYSGYTALND